MTAIRTAKAGATPIADGVRFSSGREIYANGGIVGITPGDSDCRLYGGYDQQVYWAEGIEDSPLSPEERAELRDLMIRAWTEWS